MNQETHYACLKQLELLGGKTPCCICSDHPCEPELKPICACGEEVSEEKKVEISEAFARDIGALWKFPRALSIEEVQAIHLIQLNAASAMLTKCIEKLTETDCLHYHGGDECCWQEYANPMQEAIIEALKSLKPNV